MRKNVLFLALLTVVGGLLLSNVPYTTAQENTHQHMQHQQMSNKIKVGKTGDMRINQETRIGDLVLHPGEYQFAHRVEGNKHFVRFVELKQVDAQNIESDYIYTERDKAGEVTCRLETLGKKSSKTTITATDDGGVRRITRIEVAGENVAHLF